jgi:DNA-directed RNA polymerase specialized sigma24 family protein
MKPKKRQAQHRLKPDEVAELVKAYENGEPVDTLASRFGICLDTLFCHLKRHKVSLRNEKLLRGDDLDAAAALYIEGFSLRAVGERFNVSGDTVRRALVKMGVHIRPKGRNNQQQ